MKKVLLLFSLLTIINNKSIGYCDIKGNVNNPGVYEVKENETINDIIKKAGGLKTNSYTDNINLSKLVSDEMVIYINSKKEIEKINELNTCKCEPIIKYVECDDNVITTTKNIITDKIEETTTTKKQIIKTTTTKTIETTTNKNITSEVVKYKININNASLEELIQLNGLGESKAKKIIDYRNNVGLFKSIEELLNVDGIGSKTFENIKEFIEI